MSEKIARWTANKLTKIETLIRDLGGLGARPYFYDMFFRNSPRSVEYGWILSRVGSNPKRILDIGCVGTLFPLLLANLGHNVTGIDMREYKKTHPNFGFIQGDILDEDTRGKLRGKRFDIITLVSTLEHVGILNRKPRNRDLNADIQLLQYLKSECLAQNGFILITIPYGKHEIMENQKIYGTEEIENLINNSPLTAQSKEFFQRRAGYWIPADHNKANGFQLKKKVTAICCLELRR